MGCACSKGNKTSVKSPVSRRIHAENNKPLRFGAAFSEDMLYDEDEAFLSSRAFNRKVKVWNSMCSSPNSNQTLSMEERLSRYYAENSTEFLKQLRKGPPPKYRWTAWKTALCIDKIFKKNLYSTLITPEKKSAAKWLVAIQKDIFRTFSELFKHQPNELQKSVAASLENVLVAISLHCPDIGYCQGMNYLCGFLLLVSDMREEEVFWTFTAMLRDNLMQDSLGICGLDSFYSNDFRRVNYLQGCFETLFNSAMPKLRMQLAEVPAVLWVHKWFFSLFLSSFPLGYCIRFWDLILGHGISGVLNLGLAIMKTTTAKFRKKDFPQCYELLNSFKKGEGLAPIEDIIKTALETHVDSKSLPPKPSNENNGRREKSSEKHLEEDNKVINLAQEQALDKDKASVEVEEEIDLSKQVENEPKAGVTNYTRVLHRFRAE
eukprot:TRINITY_DN11693_c0_g1_i2.p1 TRINITY_DN11693_c0_g1~~TRINITY_DN11693_c0_g1_i2.p1  ORF type:complete len:462 (-),score=47.74 TRINITY_DN11693_c0_g1_i2:39-1337(-)